MSKQFVDIDISLSRVKRRQEKILLIAYYPPRSVPSVVENISLLQKLSAYPISILNLAEHRVDSGYLKIPPQIDLSAYQAIIIHNTVAYNPDNLFSLDEKLLCKLVDYQGAKIVFKQDEHFRFRDFVKFASDVGIDTVFSIMPDSEIPKTYGEFLPSITVHPMLAAFVTPSLRAGLNLDTNRPIDIGYRGSIMPLSFGRLCYQKRKIGDDVSARLANTGVSLDISSRWEDRLGGDAWFGFLSRCKAVLGVESGTGLFDLDGTLEAYCREIEREIGPDDGSSAYADEYLKALSSREGRVGYYMISPRHFEACAAGALQILFPGNYSGCMKAGRHYFELREDYSNLQEAVDFIRDDRRRTEMAICAYEEVIQDKSNWIETFVEKFDSAVTVAMERKGFQRKAIVSSTNAGLNVVVIQAHAYGVDPRRDQWYAAGAIEELRIHQIGINDSGANLEILRGERDEVIIKQARRNWTRGCLDVFVAQAGHDVAASIALRELYFIADCLELKDDQLFTIFGLPQSQETVARFRWYLSYVLSTAVTLVHSVTCTKGVHALVAVNFPALVPGLIIKGLLGIPIIYEALEYWPEADPDQGDFLRIFWSQFESRLVGYADYRGTVSPSLAQLMGDVYKSEFYWVPNAPPLFVSNSEKPLPSSVDFSKQNVVRFIFQGNFAPHRNLEHLIRIWGKVSLNAVLILRGPENSFRAKLMEMAQSLGLLDKRVYFPPAVTVDQLIVAARNDGDVGLIPYGPTGANYSNCSPNKLGQYMMAGLPILANTTSYVADVIGAAKCGMTIDFLSEKEVIDAVSRFCDEENRRAWGNNARAHYENVFHWEAVAVPFYEAIQRATSGKQFEKFEIYLGAPRAVLEPVPEILVSPLLTECALATRRLGWEVMRLFWRFIPLKVRRNLTPFVAKIKQRL